MLVYSNIRMQSTAQVKGSAKKMVSVVATQELQAEDYLLRFKAEDPNIKGSRSISARMVFGNCCYIWDYSHLYIVFLFLFFVGSPVCVG